MKSKHLFITLFLALSIQYIFAGEVRISGTYKGKNLFVQNPFSGNMKDFCTLEVYVNGVKKITNPQSSAFEIDLSHLKLDDPVHIIIKHKDDCKPKILNPVVIRSTEDFHFVSVTADDYTISWSSQDEPEGGKHFVEHYVKDTWVTLKELPGHSTDGIKNYKIDIKHHTGTNRYRVKYLSLHGKVSYSKEIEYVSSQTPITWYPKRVTNSITLSAFANYEIMDSYGKVVKQGKGKAIDCSSLKTGFYYLNINNQTEKFLKK